MMGWGGGGFKAQGHPMKIFVYKSSKRTRNNELNTNLCLIINTKNFKCSNIYSALASQLTRFLHKMDL